MRHPVYYHNGLIIIIIAKTLVIPILEHLHLFASYNTKFNFLFLVLRLNSRYVVVCNGLLMGNIDSTNYDREL